MRNKLQTIYEYLNYYSEQEINAMICSLSDEDKALIKDRYGDDLHNPITSSSWTPERASRFYGALVPKMRKLLFLTRNSVATKNVSDIKKNNDFSTVLPQLMELIREGKTNNKICDILNINSEQLYQLLLNLKNTGLMFSKKYYSDGSIKCKLINTMTDLRSFKQMSQDETIITDINENKLKFLVISDLHFGNQLERLDLINKAYNYCAKNNINIILCGGDLIDGAFSKGEQTVSNIYQQMEYFIKHYPFDKNILTFSVAGDHDISAFHGASLNIIDMCENYRQDIVIGGFNNTVINLKNDKILLFHHIEGGVMRQTDAPIILHGHSHKYSTNIKNKVLDVTIPTLSNLIQPMPSALELNLSFNNGYITCSNIKHIYFGNEDIVLSESTFDLFRSCSNTNGVIRNTEAYKQEKAPVLTKTLTQPLSQIDKFNKRYGYADKQ